MQHLYRINFIEKAGVKTADGKKVYGGAALMRYIKLSKAKYILSGEQAVAKMLTNEKITIDPARIAAGKKFVDTVIGA